MALVSAKEYSAAPEGGSGGHVKLAPAPGGKRTCTLAAAPPSMHSFVCLDTGGKAVTSATNIDSIGYRVMSRSLKWTTTSHRESSQSV